MRDVTRNVYNADMQVVVGQLDNGILILLKVNKLSVASEGGQWKQLLMAALLYCAHNYP